MDALRPGFGRRESSVLITFNPIGLADLPARPMGPPSPPVLGLWAAGDGLGEDILNRDDPKMFGIEKRIQMRRYLEAGVSKAATARALGISRRTIYNWIDAGELGRDADDTTLIYGPRAPRSTKIDPYKIYIERRLADYPELTAARLFMEIQEDGYPGSYGSVGRHVREVRQRVRNGQVP